MVKDPDKHLHSHVHWPLYQIDSSTPSHYRSICCKTSLSLLSLFDLFLHFSNFPPIPLLPFQKRSGTSDSAVFFKAVLKSDFRTSAEEHGRKAVVKVHLCTSDGVNRMLPMSTSISDAGVFGEEMLPLMDANDLECREGTDLGVIRSVVVIWDVHQSPYLYKVLVTWERKVSWQMRIQSLEFCTRGPQKQCSGLERPRAPTISTDPGQLQSIPLKEGNELNASVLTMSQEIGYRIKIESFHICQHGGHALLCPLKQIVKPPTPLSDFWMGYVNTLRSSFLTHAFDYCCGMLSVSFRPSKNAMEAAVLSLTSSTVEPSWSMITNKVIVLDEGRRLITLRMVQARPL